MLLIVWLSSNDKVGAYDMIDEGDCDSGDTGLRKGLVVERMGGLIAVEMSRLCCLRTANRLPALRILTVRYDVGFLRVYSCNQPNLSNSSILAQLRLVDGLMKAFVHSSQPSGYHKTLEMVIDA